MPAISTFITNFSRQIVLEFTTLPYALPFRLRDNEVLSKALDRVLAREV